MRRLLEILSLLGAVLALAAPASAFVPAAVEPTDGCTPLDPGAEAAAKVLAFKPHVFAVPTIKKVAASVPGHLVAESVTNYNLVTNGPGYDFGCVGQPNYAIIAVGNDGGRAKAGRVHVIFGNLPVTISSLSQWFDAAGNTLGVHVRCTVTGQQTNCPTAVGVKPAGTLYLYVQYTNNLYRARKLGVVAYAKDSPDKTVSNSWDSFPLYQDSVLSGTLRMLHQAKSTGCQRAQVQLNGPHALFVVNSVVVHITSGGYLRPRVIPRSPTIITRTVMDYEPWRKKGDPLEVTPGGKVVTVKPDKAFVLCVTGKVRIKGKLKFPPFVMSITIAGVDFPVGKAMIGWRHRPAHGHPVGPVNNPTEDASAGLSSHRVTKGGSAQRTRPSGLSTIKCSPRYAVKSLLYTALSKLV